MIDLQLAGWREISRAFTYNITVVISVAEIPKMSNLGCSKHQLLFLKPKYLNIISFHKLGSIEI